MATPLKDGAGVESKKCSFMTAQRSWVFSERGVYYMILMRFPTDSAVTPTEPILQMFVQDQDIMENKFWCRVDPQDHKKIFHKWIFQTMPGYDEKVS